MDAAERVERYKKAMEQLRTRNLTPETKVKEKDEAKTAKKSPKPPRKNKK